MNVKAVIDTNVLVAAFWTKNRMSPTARILDAILAHSFTPLYSPEIIAEYREVLARSQFGFDAESIEQVLKCIVTTGVLVDPADSEEAFPDPDDKVFYCVALAKSDEDAKLVTGNARHYPQSSFVVTPAEFCDLIGI